MAVEPEQDGDGGALPVWAPRAAGLPSSARLEARQGRLPDVGPRRHDGGAPHPPGRPVQHYRPSVVLGRQELRRRQRPVSEGGSRHIPHVHWSAAVRKCPMHFRQAATGRTNGTRAARPACPAEGDPPAGTTRPPRGR